MRHLPKFATVLLALAMTSSAYGGEDIVIIVNKGVSISKMKKSELRPIFQTTKTSWAGGKALPLNLPASDSSRRGFDAAVLGLDPDRVARYWVDRKIRGGNPGPKNISSASLIVKIVGAKKGAIGYVPASAVGGNTKIIAKVRGGQVVGP